MIIMHIYNIITKTGRGKSAEGLQLQSGIINTVISLPQGRLSGAITRHCGTCSSNPGVGGIFFLSLAIF